MIAQLGERQTEDLKVPGSIPGHGMMKYSSVMNCLKSLRILIDKLAEWSKALR